MTPSKTQQKKLPKLIDVENTIDKINYPITDICIEYFNKGRQDALNEVLDIISYNLEYYKGHLKDLTNSPETSSTLNSWINEDLHLKKQIEELK